VVEGVRCVMMCSQPVVEGVRCVMMCSQPVSPCADTTIFHQLQAPGYLSPENLTAIWNKNFWLDLLVHTNLYGSFNFSVFIVSISFRCFHRRGHVFHSMKFFRSLQFFSRNLTSHASDRFPRRHETPPPLSGEIFLTFYCSYVGFRP